MEGTFELNKKGWYTVKVTQTNDFLNDKLENDMYGIWYSVQFQGDAQTHLWQAKKAPEAGERVYGHIEKTASGKSTKFRRAKREDTPHDPQSSAVNTQQAKYAPKDSHTEESIARAVALRHATVLIASLENDESKSWKAVKELADAELAWLQGSSESRDPKVNGTNTTSTMTVKKSIDRDERDEYNDMRSLAEQEPWGSEGHYDEP